MTISTPPPYMLFLPPSGSQVALTALHLRIEKYMVTYWSSLCCSNFDAVAVHQLQNVLVKTSLCSFFQLIVHRAETKLHPT